MGLGYLEPMARSVSWLVTVCVLMAGLVVTQSARQGGPVAWARTLQPPSAKQEPRTQSDPAQPSRTVRAAVGRGPDASGQGNPLSDGARQPQPAQGARQPQPARGARPHATTRPLADARRVLRPRGSFFVPESCGESGAYDLLVHFHGVAETMEPILRASALDAVVLVMNLGLASGPYEQMFTGKQTFQIFLESVQGELSSHCRGKKADRVAVSSWSAGYGAPLRILAHEQNRARIDAVLLADGLHGALERRYPRTVKGVALEPVTRFAERAARGESLLGITHSAILPGPYASTTETADFLLASQGIERELMDLPGPRPTMRLHSAASRAGLWVAGYAGQDAAAHCDHLFAFGQTLLPLLEARWQKG
jgi:hypothetical protein